MTWTPVRLTKHLWQKLFSMGRPTAVVDAWAWQSFVRWGLGDGCSLQMRAQHTDFWGNAERIFSYGAMFLDSECLARSIGRHLKSIREHFSSAIWTDIVARREIYCWNAVNLSACQKIVVSIMACHWPNEEHTVILLKVKIKTLLRSRFTMLIQTLAAFCHCSPD